MDICLDSAAETCQGKTTANGSDAFDLQAHTEEIAGKRKDTIMGPYSRKMVE